MVERDSLVEQVIYAEITAIVLFTKAPRPSRRLKVTIDDTKLKPTVDVSCWKQKSYRWVISPPLPVFPESNVSIWPQISFFHGGMFTWPKETKFSGKEIISQLKATLKVTQKDNGQFCVGMEANLQWFSFDNMINITYDPKSHGGILQGISALTDTLNAIASPPDILRGCAPILNILSQAHPIAQAAAMVISLPYTLLKKESDYNDQVRQVGDQIRNLLPQLKDISLIMTSESLSNIVIRIIELIVQITRFIGAYLKENYLGRNAQILSGSSSLAEFNKKLGALNEELSRAIQVQMAQILYKIDTRSLLNGIKERLKPVNLAELDHGFLEGTRIKILEQIEDWMHTSDAKNIFYIYGSPGAGKTTVASRIVTTLMPEEVRVRFFFKRDLESLREPKFVWRTIAYQLADLYDEYRLYLDKFLNDTGKTAYFEDADVPQQFQDLIMKPLQNLKDKFRNYPKFLIDAIDECDPQKKKDRQQFLNCLGKWQSLPSVFKLIVTSRDDTDIHRIMENISNSVALLTGEEADEDSVRDVHMFLKKGFEDIQVQPGDSAIEKLTTYAAGLFIWARTVIDFIEEGDPMQRLADVVSNIHAVPLHEGINGKINALYGQILYSIVNLLTEKERNAYEIILGTILFAKEPLQPSALEKLIYSLKAIHPSVESINISFVLRKFRTVLKVSDADDPVRVRHVSFGDFYFSGPDRMRGAIAAYAKVRQTEPPNFSTISPVEHDGNLMVASIRAMNSGLKFDICGFPSSYQMNKEIPSLRDRIPLALVYSSLHWAEHLRVEIATHAYVLPDITEFLHEHLLEWLEILSAVEAVANGVTLLLTAATTLESIGETGLGRYCRDASRFITTFRQPISESIPHIYISCLPFAPEQSPVARMYQSKFPYTMSLISGRMTQWPHILQVVIGHKAMVASVVFSPDGKWIVSGSYDETIRIWDANTGRVMGEPLQGHTGAVTSVAVSYDGKYVASASDDNSVIIWDTVKKQPALDPLHGHQGPVTTVAFSPDGEFIVTGSTDKTLRKWRRTTSQCVKVLNGHLDHITAVAFSPQGDRFVSCSQDKTLRVWDSVRGANVLEPLSGHKASVSCVACSPDGKYIASGSEDQTILLWNSTTGERHSERMTGHASGVTCLAYSPDGKCIISGSSDQTIRVWDAKTGQSLSDPLQGCTSPISSVAFSPDGKHFVSGSHDGTIQVWDSFVGRNQLSASSLQRPSTVVGTVPGGWDPIDPLDYVEDPEPVVSLSPDGKYLISSSNDGSICVCDATTGQDLSDIGLNAHLVSVLPVSFAMDGLRVVSLRARQIFNIEDPGSEEKPLALSLFPDTEPSVPQFAFLDAFEQPCFSNYCKIIDGWLSIPNGRRSGDHLKLFWLPGDNRFGLMYPQSKRVMGASETKIDFSRFVHGRRWALSRRDT